MLLGLTLCFIAGSIAAWYIVPYVAEGIWMILHKIERKVKR